LVADFISTDAVAPTVRDFVTLVFLDEEPLVVKARSVAVAFAFKRVWTANQKKIYPT
jgi:hypothetical protein